MPAASKSLVTTRSNCPLCASSSRREIDILIHARHFSTDDPAQEPIIVSESDPDNRVDITTVAHNDTYLQTYNELKELLSKIPSDSTAEFSLSDLIIHATQHTLVTELANSALRSEGALLFYGDRVYKKVDPIDFMDLILIQGLEQLANGTLVITLNGLINVLNTRWRMTGNTGDDGFLGAIMDKVTAGVMDDDSPVSTGYREHQAKLAKARAKQKEQETPDADPAETTEV